MAERDQAAKERDQWRQYQWAAPGHFYSPVPSLEELKQQETAIWGPPPLDIPGVDLNEAGQARLFEALKTYYPEMPAYERHKQEGLRYFYKNGYFPLGDAIILYGMIRHLRPRRIIEIGSGFSSAVTLDTNQLYFDNHIACTFIEPHPGRLFNLMEEGDRARCEVIQSNLQEVPLSCFEQLAANDILFIDSTHVAKTHSDVNYYLFHILPALASGVYIHIHDVFYPFEYPKGWVYQGITWNEDYLLRAFLQYNQRFQIQFFSSFLEQFHRVSFLRDMPLYLTDPGGSLWLKKV
ncbi:MAG: class I SAM-dependent methyltransferase [Planctomycetes bacterium]|nr:class I SAM-dependent methyltransferase [Planctomycetota bacterium]